MSALCVHGFRATFRTWTGDRSYPFDLCEFAIGHRVGDATAQGACTFGLSPLRGGNSRP
jgi:hypothetical protein